MQAMAIPLSNFITKFGAVLAITLWDRDIFAATALCLAHLEWLNFAKHALYRLKISSVASICEMSADPIILIRIIEPC